MDIKNTDESLGRVINRRAIIVIVSRDWMHRFIFLGRIGITDIVFPLISSRIFQQRRLNVRCFFD